MSRKLVARPYSVWHILHIQCMTYSHVQWRRGHTIKCMANSAPAVHDLHSAPGLSPDTRSSRSGISQAGNWQSLTRFIAATRLIGRWQHPISLHMHPQRYLVLPPNCHIIFLLWLWDNGFLYLQRHPSHITLSRWGKKWDSPTTLDGHSEGGHGVTT